jgi:hypothetical protein
MLFSLDLFFTSEFRIRYKKILVSSELRLKEFDKHLYKMLPLYQPARQNKAKFLTTAFRWASLLRKADHTRRRMEINKAKFLTTAFLWASLLRKADHTRRRMEVNKAVFALQAMIFTQDGEI